MKRATRRVGLDDLRDLLAAAPRANIAFGAGGEVHALPVAFRYSAGRYLVGVPGRARGPAPGGGDQVELLIDDGQWFFDLRGVRVRGRLEPAEAPAHPSGHPEDPGLSWFELTPEKTVAWDYGRMREVTR